MTEQEQQIEVKQDAAPVAGGGVAPAVSEPDKKPQMSEGEKKFEWWTYKGLNYWVNLISSVAIADWLLKPQSSGNKWLHSKIENTTIAISKIVKPSSLKSVHWPTKTGIETLAFMAGGWLLVLPMWGLENNKRPIVHWLNKKSGVDQTAPDGHEETPEEIHIEKEQPKQSLWHALMRRVYATIAVVSSGMALEHWFRDKKTMLPPETYKIGGETIVYEGRVLGGKDRLTNKIVGWANEVLKHAPMGLGEKLTAEGKMPNRWLNLLALDTFLTIITAVVMYVTSGSKKGKMPCEIDDSKDKPSHESHHKIVPDAPDEKAQCFVEKVARDGKKPTIEKKAGVERKSLAPDELLASMQREGSVPALGM